MKSDKLKFHRLTKPIKFRRFKVFFKSVGHTYEVGIERVKYFFNYVLYKLNILKRYTNSVDMDIWRPTINGEVTDVHERPVETKHFAGVVQTALVDHLTSKVDYFYYTDLKGLKHITYTVENWERHLYKLVASFIKPALILDGKVYQFGEVPRVVRQFKQPEIKPFDASMSAIPVEPEVVTYDLSKLLNVKYECILGCDSDSEAIMGYVQHSKVQACTEITNYLSTLTLHDLEV